MIKYLTSMKHKCFLIEVLIEIDILQYSKQTILLDKINYKSVLEYYYITVGLDTF